MRNGVQWLCVFWATILTISLDIGGQNYVSATVTASGQRSAFAWSPDGTKLMFTGASNDGASRAERCRTKKSNEHLHRRMRGKHNARSAPWKCLAACNIEKTMQLVARFARCPLLHFPRRVFEHDVRQNRRVGCDGQV
jgi:hypothetical protein